MGLKAYIKTKALAIVVQCRDCQSLQVLGHLRGFTTFFAGFTAYGEVLANFIRNKRPEKKCKDP